MADILKEITKRFSSEAGGPLTPTEIANQLKDPQSILNKALAGFVTYLSLIEEQMKHRVMLDNREMQWAEAYKREKEDVAVGRPGEEEELQEEAMLEREVQKIQETTAKQSDAYFLYELHKDLGKLSETLNVQTIQQLDSYNDVIESAKKNDPVYAKFELTPVDQKKLHDVYKETVKNVEQNFDKLKLPPEQSAPVHKQQKIEVAFEVKFMANRIGVKDAEGDVTSLKPSDVVKMLKLTRDKQTLFQGYLADEKAICKTEDKIAGYKTKIFDLTQKMTNDMTQRHVDKDEKDEKDYLKATRGAPKLKLKLPGSRE